MITDELELNYKSNYYSGKEGNDDRKNLIQWWEEWVWSGVILLEPWWQQATRSLVGAGQRKLIVKPNTFAHVNKEFLIFLARLMTQKTCQMFLTWRNAVTTLQAIITRQMLPNFSYILLMLVSVIMDPHLFWPMYWAFLGHLFHCYALTIWGLAYSIARYEFYRRNKYRNRWFLFSIYYSNYKCIFFSYIHAKVPIYIPP